MKGVNNCKALKKMPSQEELAEVLDFYPETGRLFHKGCGRPYFNYDGREAFTFKTPNGYMRGRVLGDTHFAHRVIWKLVHGTDAELIDHINGVRTDNRPANLRSVSHIENCRNQRIARNNSSGINGVSWNVKARKWVAAIRPDGKYCYLGSFDDAALAGAAVAAAKHRFGFHPNHGQRLQAELAKAICDIQSLRLRAA